MRKNLWRLIDSILKGLLIASIYVISLNGWALLPAIGLAVWNFIDGLVRSNFDGKWKFLYAVINGVLMYVLYSVTQNLWTLLPAFGLIIWNFIYRKVREDW